MSVPKLTGITRRTPHLFVGFLRGSAQALKAMVVFHPHGNEKSVKLIDSQPRANVLLAGRRVLHIFLWVMVHPSHETQRGARNHPPKAREVELPLRMAPLSPRRLGT